MVYALSNRRISEHTTNLFLSIYPKPLHGTGRYERCYVEFR